MCSERLILNHTLPLYFDLLKIENLSHLGKAISMPAIRDSTMIKRNILIMLLIAN